MKLINALFFLCLVVFFSQAGLSGELPEDGSREQLCLSTAWPHEKSDLAPDPALVFGRLDNGFRYILLRNQEPKGRVGVYLNIQAGSLHETEEQRGIAHFLEHMVFNGSTHFPPGSLVEYFQSIGMSFGGDTNAHTGFDETVYHILLPGGSREELKKGLLVMSDYARGALLSETEIDRERGV
ncbi:MAG: insulinase family protein, partial [Desulfobulbaceae bacterium]